VKIKWPNDIYVDNEKIAGILIQNSIVGNEIEFSVCGMGINVNQTIFSADAPNAVSLKSLSGKDYNCEILLEQVLRNIYV
jgi:BirA family transcriptional regulator, biotin operon repressor / biotin---[acetyl-CoA-carboxylase] ligase